MLTATAGAFRDNLQPIQKIQRLGCGVARQLQPFRNAVFSPFHEKLVSSLGYEDPRVTQSLVVAKPAGVGRKVVPHQDGCSSFTDPPSCTTFWYALEDTTAVNGCLEVVPGSHRSEPIKRRCRQDQFGEAEFVDIEKPVWAEINGKCHGVLPSRDSEGKYVYQKLEVKAGTLVLMHGNLLHRSEANTSDRSRIAFNFSVVEGRHQWPVDNYLQPYEGYTELEKLRAL